MDEDVFYFIGLLDLILMRTLFMLGSMKTFSFSFRATVKGLSKTSGELTTSISGTLCVSEVCDRDERDSVAVKDDRTHWRYGLRDCYWGC